MQFKIIIIIIISDDDYDNDDDDDNNNPFKVIWCELNNVSFVTANLYNSEKMQFLGNNLSGVLHILLKFQEFLLEKIYCII